MSAPHVRVWCLRTDGFANRPAASAVLSLDERERSHRFKVDDAREQFIAGRWLLRSLLSQSVGVAPADCRLAQNADGRPYLAWPESPALDFNLSHTKGLAVVALALGGPRVGVDVERADRSWTDDLPGRFFSAVEVAALSQLPPDIRQQRFFDYWTLKESFLKAVGTGLRTPLSTFSIVGPDSPSPRIQLHDQALGEAAEHWHFSRREPIPGYTMGLAIRWPAGAVRVDVHEFQG